MFSKELEEVIEAALADGTITEKERAVLHKRALAEGVDPDELDVVIEGRLSKMKKEEDWLRPVPPPQAAPANNGKHGSVRKCPNCGAVVEAAAVKCAECGYEFVGIEANSSVIRFAEQLNEIERRFAQQNITNRQDTTGIGFLMSFLGSGGEDHRTNEIISFISSFPVPTTKEDLLEFTIYVQPKTIFKGEEPAAAKICLAYRTKHAECIEKARFFFNNDPQFQPLFEQYEESNKNKKKSWLKQDRAESIVRKAEQNKNAAKHFPIILAGFLLLLLMFVVITCLG